MKKILALGLAALLTGCSAQKQNIAYHQSKAYENNNTSLQEGAIQEAYKSVVKIEVSAD